MEQEPRTAQRNRDRILAGAVSCFAQHGFNGASTREIARTAGVKEPLIFYHFHSKADLYVAAHRDQITKLAAGLDTALGDEHAVLARLRAFVEVYLRYYLEEEPGLMVALREVTGLPPDLGQLVVNTFQQEITTRVQHIIEDGIAQGVLRPFDPVACAAAITGLLHVFLRRHRPGEVFNHQRVIEQVCDVYAAGLLAPSDASRPAPRRRARAAAASSAD